MLIFFRGKIIDVAEVNKWLWLEESGQWLENVDQLLSASLQTKWLLVQLQSETGLFVYLFFYYGR